MERDKKGPWLLQNSLQVAGHFNNECQECKVPTSHKKGSIHHLKYPKSYTEYPLDALFKMNAITWLCKECHRKAHTANFPYETSLNTKHSGYCIVCDKFQWHAWFKVKSSIKLYYADDNLPFCSKCVKQLIKLKLLSKQKAYTNGGRFLGDYIGFTNWKEIDDPNSRLIMNHIINQAKNRFSKKVKKKKIDGIKQMDFFNK